MPPGCELLLCRFADQATGLREVRGRVFIDEQQVPQEEEWDDRDPHCVHALLRCDGEAIACGRLDLQPGAPQQGKIGRVAVLAPWRNHGLGVQIMQALEAEAIRSGLQSTWLYAQVSALGFYERLGYSGEGERFMEAGIEHLAMRKNLTPAH
nr:GNAT family N-acetyltransferase [Pseudomaricurvus sp. HS19]